MPLLLCRPPQRWRPVRAWSLLFSVVAPLAACSSDDPATPSSGSGGQGSSSTGTPTTTTTGSGAGGDTGATSGTGGAFGTGGDSSASGAGGAGGDSSASGTGGGGGGASGTGGEGAGGEGGSGDRCAEAVYNPSSPPTTLSLSGDLGTHDPAPIRVGDGYYLFQTGRGIPIKTSSNLTEWRDAGRVFEANPSWIEGRVPGVTDLWAPDISYFGDTYHLYYSASTFGSNRSCIGHATKRSLDSREPWTDHGPLICSNPPGEQHNWNAIDPNVVLDESGTPWLSFGSFWSGIKMVKLNLSGERADSELHSLAARPAAGDAIEAPFIVRRCGFYYLFVSFDSCCRGVNSTYKTAVGRSTSITGPYVDKEGRMMMNGGGTVLVQGAARWRGPGHNAVLFTNGRAYNVYHAYDANASGAPTLRISDLVWDDDGWPISGGP